VSAFADWTIKAFTTPASMSAYFALYENGVLVVTTQQGQHFRTAAQVQDLDNGLRTAAGR
jgi:hypothetical protein